MSIRGKIVVPIVSSLLILISAVALLWLYVSSVKAGIERKFELNHEINRLSSQINVERQLARHNTLQYRITKNDYYVSAYTSNTQEINKLLEELRPLVVTEQGKKLLFGFEDLRDDVVNSRNLLNEVIANGTTSEVNRHFLVWEINADNATAALQDFTNYYAGLLDTANKEYEELIIHSFLFALLVVIIQIVLYIVLFYYFRQVITIPITNITNAAEKISAGEFNTKLNINSADELGILAKKIEVMSKNLHQYYLDTHNKIRRKETELRKIKEFESQKDTFMSIASHELKTPVTSLSVYRHLLEKEAKKHGHSQYERYLQKMDDQVKKLTNLISSLLDVTRIKSGKMPLHMNKFDIDACLHDSVELARNAAPLHTFEQLGKIKRKLFGDQEKISQVIDNLLSNAVRYSPAGGKIILRSEIKDGMAKISIQDFGIGIEKKYHKKIFGRFYRVTGSDEQTYPGMGIGLYICLDIIKSHSGKLWVESEKGKGSTFIFTLPLHARG